MRFFKAKVRIIALPLLVFLLILMASPSGLEKTRGVCAGAYIKCMISAGLLGLTGGLLAVAWGIGCQIGMIWCLEYFG